MFVVAMLATCLFASNSYGQCGVRYSQYSGPSYGYAPVHRPYYGYEYRPYYGYEYRPVYGYRTGYVVSSNVVYSTPVYSNCYQVVTQQSNQSNYAPKKEVVKEPVVEKTPVMPSPNYNQNKPTPEQPPVPKVEQPIPEQEEILEPKKVESPSPFIDVPVGKPTIYNNFVQNKRFN